MRLVFSESFLMSSWAKSTSFFLFLSAFCFSVTVFRLDRQEVLDDGSGGPTSNLTSCQYFSYHSGSFLFGKIRTKYVLADTNISDPIVVASFPSLQLEDHRTLSIRSVLADWNHSQVRWILLGAVFFHLIGPEALICPALWGSLQSD